MSVRHYCCAMAMACSLLAAPGETISAEVELKNGMLLQGAPAPLAALSAGPQARPPSPHTIIGQPIVMVTNELVRYYVAERQVLKIDRERDAAMKLQEVFKLPQVHKGSVAINSLGGILEATPFDPFGRRRLVLKTARGDLDVIQGITRLAPDYARIEGLTHKWETAIPTTSLGADVLEKILRQATDGENPDHHLAIARFYMQAEMYRQAQQELAKVQARFPDLKERSAEVSASLAQLQGQQLLQELKLRQGAGQHQLAAQALQQFPGIDRVEASLLREIRELIASYERLRETYDQVIAALGELQAELSPERVAAVAPCRAEIRERLHPENIGRLEAFLKLKDDKTLSAEDRLGLAFSGWILGASHAESDLALALRLWHARFLMQQFLRSENPNEREALTDELQKIEGLTVERAALILQHGTPLDPSLAALPGTPAVIQVSSPGQKPDIRYSVLLPPEYHPNHSYPVIVALGERNAPLEQAITFWGGTAAQPGQAQRHGYIVIAPDYMPDNLPYDYGSERHQVVLESLRDARRRFNIDSDRIFLTGHGRGGTAAFDIGLSHPDLFAGLIPISGVSDNKCKYYWSNAKLLPIYVLSGELDRDTFAQNVTELNRMFAHGYDAMLAEYRGYGRDSFYAEIHRLFVWMALHRRAKLPQEFEINTLRQSDNRFYWLEFSSIPQSVITNNRPMLVKAKATPGNSLVIHCSAASVTVWLTPDVLKFDQRVVVRINGQQKFNKPLKPDLKALLEDFRVRADRQRLYWAVLEF